MNQGTAIVSTLLCAGLLGTSVSASEGVLWASLGQNPETPRPIAVVGGRQNAIDFVLAPDTAPIAIGRISLYGLGGPLAAPLIARLATTLTLVPEGSPEMRQRLAFVVPQAAAGTRLLLVLETSGQKPDAPWQRMATATLEVFSANQLDDVRAFAHGSPLAIDDSLPWLKEFFRKEDIACTSLSKPRRIAPALGICTPTSSTIGSRPPEAAVLLVLCTANDAEQLIIVRPRPGGGTVEAHLPRLRFLATDPRVRQDFLRAFRLAADLLPSSQTHSNL
jgi:hypothetical protein